jgi:DNA-binding MarR family transcriptional regulator
MEHMKNHIGVPAAKKTRKTQDPHISLYVMLDNTRNLMFKAIEMELAQYQMTAAQVRVLDALSRKDEGLSLSDLAERDAKELNSMSALVSRMAKKGLVTKTRKPGDYKTYVMVTEAGKEVFENTVTEKSIHLILDSLSAAEREQLQELLAKVHVKARAVLGLDYKPPFLE